MERLTKRLEDGQAVMDCAACLVSWHKKREKDIPYCTALFCRNRLKERLAAYEDTGMEPEEIKNALDVNDIIPEINVTVDHIRDLLQAEQDGRLVVLPCKVGDTIWRIKCFADWPDIGKPYVEAGAFLYRDIHYFGKTVFLTREEAEAALAGKGGKEK